MSHAFHSHRVDPMLSEFASVAKEVTYGRARIPIVSSLTGRPAEPHELSDPDYWVAQVRGTVRFADGVAALRDCGVRTFVEIGPDAVLAPAAGHCVPDGRPPIPLLRARRPETQTLLGPPGPRPVWR